MSDYFEAAKQLAADLIAAEDPPTVLPENLPCTPLELLIALHAEVRQTMLSDIAYAQRAAARAHMVAETYPTALHYAQAHWSQGSAILYLPNYVGALAHYDAALECYRQACREAAPHAPQRDIRPVHVVRVFCLSELGRYQEAIAAVEAAEQWLHDHPEPYIHLTLLLNRSQLAGSMGNYVEMVILADATIQLAVSLDHTDRAAQGWVNRANGCIMLGRYPEAEIAIQNALDAAIIAEEPLTIARARCCKAWLLHHQGHLFAALTELRAAMPGFEQAPDELAMLLLEEATISAQLRQLPEALSAARQSAMLFARQQMTAYSVNALLTAARIAIEHDQTQTALQILTQAQSQIVAGSNPLIDAEIALVLSLLATHAESGTTLPKRTRNLKHAKKSAATALAILAAARLDLAYAQGRMICAAIDRELGLIERAIEHYRSLLDHHHPAIRMAAFGELGNILPPEQALPLLEEATRLVVQQRRVLPMEEIQARYSSEMAHYHMRLAQCAIDLGQIERAASAIWEAKAGAMLDLRVAGSNNDLAEDAHIAASKAHLARLQRLIQEHTRSASAASHQDQHEQATFHLQQVRHAEAELGICAKELTSYARILADDLGSQPVPTLAAVQATLSPTEVVLEWFQIGDMLYCMLLSKDAPPLVRPITRTRTVVRLIDQWNLVAHRYQGHAQQQSLGHIQQALKPLSDLLLGPWSEHLHVFQKLIIAPCGVLYQLPWVALVAELAAEKHLILTPSAALWAAPIELGITKTGPPRILGYQDDAANYLAHLERELAAIASHVPDAIIISPATTNDLRQSVAPRILHIGSHGTTNTSAPLCSALQLADGPFLLLEAHRLELHGTSLVVLSACETSVRPDHGDMVLALAGAFLCAGSETVIASLWRISDEATAVLMDRLYAWIAQGDTPPAALLKAQHSMRTTYPLDWAAFQCWSGTSQYSGLR